LHEAISATTSSSTSTSSGPARNTAASKIGSTAGGSSTATPDSQQLCLQVAVAVTKTGLLEALQRQLVYLTDAWRDEDTRSEGNTVRGKGSLSVTAQS